MAKEKVSQVRPWVRFFARMIDYALFSVAMGIFLAIFVPIIYQLDNILLGLILILLWIPVEALFLSRIGTTPGKWILRTSVTDAHGRKLKYEDAGRRAVMVWFRGLGMGIPIVTLVTHIIAYSNLTTYGKTTWDRDGKFKVIHKKIGLVRTIIAILFLLFILSLNFLG